MSGETLAVRAVCALLDGLRPAPGPGDPGPGSFPPRRAPESIVAQTATPSVQPAQEGAM